MLLAEIIKICQYFLPFYLYHTNKDNWYAVPLSIYTFLFLTNVYTNLIRINIESSKKEFERQQKMKQLYPNVKEKDNERNEQNNEKENK